MRENKLRMKVTAIPLSLAGRRVSPLYYDRVRTVVPAVAQCNCGGGRSHYINRDGRLRFLRTN